MDPFRPLPLRSARRLHDVWQAFNDAKIPQNFLGRFLDNADFQRIVSIDPSLVVLRCASVVHDPAAGVQGDVSDSTRKLCGLCRKGCQACMFDQTALHG